MVFLSRSIMETLTNQIEDAREALAKERQER